MNKPDIHQALRPFVIEGLGINGQKIEAGQKITVVNIICPGYVRRREAGVEHFDFTELSPDISECPNVQLMITKMQKLVKGLGNRMETVMILADLAILNFEELSKNQNVKEILGKFYVSIKKSGLYDPEKVRFLKMSELPEFGRIPRAGIKVNIRQKRYEGVDKEVAEKSLEYEGVLVFSRMNELMSKRTGINFKKLEMGVNREVARFVAEYGTAGKAIQKMYANPVIAFTEPSGYLRGYFYNAYLKPAEQLAVIYLK